MQCPYTISSSQEMLTEYYNKYFPLRSVIAEQLCDCGAPLPPLQSSKPQSSKPIEHKEPKASMIVPTMSRKEVENFKSFIWKSFPSLKE